MVPLPHSTRSQVFNALFAFIQKVPPPVGGPNWRTASQWLKQWDDVNSADQPAIFLHRGPQTAEQKHVFGVIKWQWRATIWIYFRVDNLKTATSYPDQYTDAYLDAFEQLFQTDALNQRLTLGDLVWHCWIDGTIISDPGINDNQALIIIPISILL